MDDYEHLKVKKGSQAENRIWKSIQFIIPLFLLGVFWEALARSGNINDQIMPMPSAILRTFYDLSLAKGALLQHLLSSLYRLSMGYILAVGLGIIVGSMLAIHRFTRDMFSVTLSLLISVPTIAWVPVLLITTGLGEKTMIIAIFLGGVFEVIYSTIAGIRSINRQHVDAARIMGVTRGGLFFKVILPGSLLSIVPALRLSISYCWRALVGAEMLCAMVKWGLGKMVYEARFWNDVKVMFVGLILIGILTVSIDELLLKQLEQKTIVRWGMVERS